MSRTCSCSAGGCGRPEPVAVNRRDFMATLAAGAASLTAAGELNWAKPSGAAEGGLTVPQRPQGWDYPITSPRVYHGKHLEAVAMPIGGIGTGSIWLDGRGRRRRRIF